MYKRREPCHWTNRTYHSNSEHPVVPAYNGDHGAVQMQHLAPNPIHLLLRAKIGWRLAHLFLDDSSRFIINRKIYFVFSIQLFPAWFDRGSAIYRSYNIYFLHFSGVIGILPKTEGCAILMVRSLI